MSKTLFSKTLARHISTDERKHMEDKKETDTYLKGIQSKAHTVAGRTKSGKQNQVEFAVRIFNLYKQLKESSRGEYCPSTLAAVLEVAGSNTPQPGNLPRAQTEPPYSFLENLRSNTTNLSGISGTITSISGIARAPEPGQGPETTHHDYTWVLVGALAFVVGGFFLVKKVHRGL